MTDFERIAYIGIYVYGGGALVALFIANILTSNKWGVLAAIGGMGCGWLAHNYFSIGRDDVGSRWGAASGIFACYSALVYALS